MNWANLGEYHLIPDADLTAFVKAVENPFEFARTLEWIIHERMNIPALQREAERRKAWDGAREMTDILAEQRGDASGIAEPVPNQSSDAFEYINQMVEATRRKQEVERRAADILMGLDPDRHSTVCWRWRDEVVEMRSDVIKGTP